MDATGVVGDIFGGVAMVAAIIAAVYAARAPSREDLKCVEDHLGNMVERVGEQQKQEMIKTVARRLKIRVQGDQIQGHPLPLKFTVESDEEAQVTGVDLLDHSRVQVGSATCAVEDNNGFSAFISEDVAREWFNSGQVAERPSERRLHLRVHMVFQRVVVTREFSVKLTDVFPNATSGLGPILRVQGRS